MKMFLKAVRCKSTGRTEWKDIEGRIGMLNRLMKGDTTEYVVRLAFQEIGEVSSIEQVYLCQRNGEYAATNVFLVHVDDKVMGYDNRIWRVLDFNDAADISMAVLNYAIALQAIAYCGGMLNKLELTLSES